MSINKLGSPIRESQDLENSDNPRTSLEDDCMELVEEYSGHTASASTSDGSKERH